MATHNFGIMTINGDYDDNTASIFEMKERYFGFDEAKELFAFISKEIKDTDHHVILFLNVFNGVLNAKIGGQYFPLQHGHEAPSYNKDTHNLRAQCSICSGEIGTLIIVHHIEVTPKKNEQKQQTKEITLF